MRDAGTFIKLANWFLSLDKPKQGNLRLTVITLAVGVAIYTKPEVFGPWVNGILNQADLSTWIIVALAGICVYNISSSAQLREHRMEEHIDALRQRVNALETELREKNRYHDERVDDIKREYTNTINLVVAQRERALEQASIYRTAIAELIVVASSGGGGAEVKRIVCDMNEALAA